MTKKVLINMVRINGLMPAKLKDELEKLAEEEGTTLSHLIRMACVKYLKESKK